MIRQTADGNSIGMSTSRSSVRSASAPPHEAGIQTYSSPQVNSNDSQQTIYNLQPARNVFYEMCFKKKEARPGLLAYFFSPNLRAMAEGWGGRGWPWPPHAQSQPLYWPFWPDSNHPFNHRISGAMRQKWATRLRSSDRVSMARHPPTLERGRG